MNISLVPLPVIIAGLIGILFITFQLVHLLRRTQSTVFNKTIVSLCISDFLSCLSFIGAGVASIMKSNWGVSCTFAAMAVFVAASVFHLIFMGLQRLVAIALPLKVSRIFSATRCVFILCSIWIAAFMYGVVISHIFKNYAQVVNSVAVVVTGTILFALYIGIGVKITKRGQDSSMIPHNSKSLRKNRLVYVHSVCVTVTFVLSYAPLATEMLYLPANLESYYISQSLMALNPIMNALVYFCIQFFRHRQLEKQSRRISFKQHYKLHSTPKRVNTRARSQRRKGGTQKAKQRS